MFAIVPAAGSSTRMSLCSNESKVFSPVGNNHTVISLALDALSAAAILKGIVVVVRGSDRKRAAEVTRRVAADNSIEIFLVEGGATRQESVFNGLNSLAGKARFVLVHDAARPFCLPEHIRAVASCAEQTGAAILAVPVKSTLKRGDKTTVAQTISRNNLWEAQTPQAFGYELLLKAHLSAQKAGFVGTDESEVVERLGATVSLVEGSAQNIKITTAEDLNFAVARSQL